MIIDTSVDPGVPIYREATLVHGITDADVRGKPGVHRVMEELEPLLEQHGLIASHNVRFTRTALNSSLGRERIGFHRPMTMCAMKTYAGFRSEMNPATGEHAWASLAQIELFVNPDSRWSGSMKSLRFRVVNWNRVESLRQRSNGFSIPCPPVS